MELNEYQQLAKRTNIYPDDAFGWVCLALGVAGEAGEVADCMKKMYRDCEDFCESTMYELGDVLWYVSQLANSLGYSLEEVAEHNLNKLQSRHNRGVIGGSGDDR